MPAAAATSAVTSRGAAALDLPQVIVNAGAGAAARYLEFFAARRERADAGGGAFSRVVRGPEARGLGLDAVSPLHVAAYIRTHPGSVPTVKQHLAAIRMLCDWLVVSQAAVRGRKHVVTKGSTPVPAPAEPRQLLDRIDTATLAGLRGPGAPLGDVVQLRAGERGPGDAATGLLRAGEPGVAAAP